MRSDAKLIVGLSALVFAVLHLTLLGAISLSPEGETRGWMILFLEFPLHWLVPPEASGASPFYAVYLWVGGTVMYACVGALLGLFILAARRVFKKLNA